MSSVSPWPKFGYIVTLRGSFPGARRLPRIGEGPRGPAHGGVGFRGPRSQEPYSHPWLADLPFALDGRLQRRHAVFEYTGNPVCIFRVDVACSPERLALRDGTRLQRGERIAPTAFLERACAPGTAGRGNDRLGAADAACDRDFAAGACMLP